MPATLVTVNLPHADGLARDTVVNEFVFYDPSSPPGSSSVTDVMSAITAFYNTATGSGFKVSNYIGAQISRAANAVGVKFYDITDALGVNQDHGSPFTTSSFTLGAMSVGATSLPSEVSVAMTFRALYDDLPEFGPELGPGGGHVRPRARRRGRIYIGPLTASVFTNEATTNRVYVGSQFRIGLAEAGSRLALDANTVWSVWSRVDAATHPVQTGWVDDAIDIQRRRGERPVARSFFP